VVEALFRNRQTALNIRGIGKYLAHGSGTLGAYHKRRNAETLTVLMFHRVLPATEMTRLGADPLYTVTPAFLSECLAFLRKHYTIVSLGDVALSKEQTKPLPPLSALITFDDGWHDNMEYAMPILAGTPWTLFASLDAVLEPECWWQEILLWAVRTARCDPEKLLGSLASHADFSTRKSYDPLHSLLTEVAALPEAARASLLGPYRVAHGAADKRMMLDSEDLQTMSNAGISIGAHGTSHLPVTMISDSRADLSLSKSALAEILGFEPQAMSFPHGVHDSRTVAEAKEAGYTLLFTSEPYLNPCENGWLGGDTIGRIPIAMHDVADEKGRLAPHKLATWLFLRGKIATGETH
jgi:peptidoglycan/xylan/chitin deacetylase (PgdA/CDA1 family)